MWGLPKITKDKVMNFKETSFMSFQLVRVCNEDKKKIMSENILGHWDKGTANLTLKEMIIMYEGVSPH